MIVRWRISAVGVPHRSLSCWVFPDSASARPNCTVSPSWTHWRDSPKAREQRRCRRKRSRPAEDTLRLLAEGRTFEEIARIRGRQLASVVGLVADLVEKGKLEFQNTWVESDKQQSIESACARLGTQWLKPLKEALPPEISFEEIRLIVARLRQQQVRASA